MNFILSFAVLSYAVAMIAANLTVAAAASRDPSLIPLVTGANAFLLIGLDLALRDWLHVRLRPLQMLVLIGATGALTFALNPAAGMIAVASALSFTGAALVDWQVFARMRGTWLQRSNASNVAGAAVDSLLFPTLAFGALLPQVVLVQFAAKVLGGAAWAWVLRARLGRTA